VAYHRAGHGSTDQQLVKNHPYSPAGETSKGVSWNPVILVTKSSKALLSQPAEAGIKSTLHNGE
jgi:hypothetical protein